MAFSPGRRCTRVANAESSLIPEKVGGSRPAQAPSAHCTRMKDDNVYQPEPSNRDDLKHTDTVSTASDASIGDPEEQTARAASEDGPIGMRVDRDPSNLGNDIPEEGDLTHPAPVNQPLGKSPGM
jgi:hypothetical protein